MQVVKSVLYLQPLSRGKENDERCEGEVDLKYLKFFSKKFCSYKKGCIFAPAFRKKVLKEVKKFIEILIDSAYYKSIIRELSKPF